MNENLQVNTYIYIFSNERELKEISNKKDIKLKMIKEFN